MKLLKELLQLNEVMVRGVTQNDWNILSRLPTDELEDFINASEQDGLSYDELAKHLLDAGFSSKVNNPEYIDALIGGMENEYEARVAHWGEDNFDDLRDYDEEDRMSAWEDRYNMYKNEY